MDRSERPRVTALDHAHFRVVASDNRAVTDRHLREVMAESPGRRMETALALSDAHLGGRPSPERKEAVSLFARWRAVRAGRG